MPTPVTWQVDDSLPVMLVRLNGRLDTATADTVRDTLNGCLAAQPDALVVDVRDLAIIDRDAVAVFAAAARQAADWPGIPLAVVGSEGPLPAYAEPATALPEVARRGPVPRVRLRLQPMSGACRRAREFAVDACDRWGLAAMAGPVSVVISELVTNVVRHAGTAMDVRLTLRAPQLHVAVADGHQGTPRPATPRPTTEGGRGLLLVRSLTQRWGFLPIGQGKVVWATLATT